MNKKIIVIGIVSVILLTSVTTLSVVGIKTCEEQQGVEIIKPKPGYLYTPRTGIDGMIVFRLDNLVLLWGKIVLDIHLVLFDNQDLVVTAYAAPDADMVKFIADKSNGETTTIDIYSDDGLFSHNFGKLPPGIYMVTAVAYNGDVEIDRDSVRNVIYIPL
jgi:hypothetical protein